MKIDAVVRVLTRKVQARLPVILVGAPGVGKTDIAYQVGEATEHDMLVSHPVVSDPTDAKGLPYPDKKGTSARFLPYGVMARALAATRPTLWFLDDLGQAAPAVQAAYMQLLLARRIDEHVLPDCVTFVAATNRKQDRAGVNGMLEPVKSRFCTILNVEPDHDAWINWALRKGLPPVLIAYLQLNPAALHAPAPTTELVNSPSPRTWHNAAKLMQAGLDEEPAVALEELGGAIGNAAATELFGFMQVAHDMPSIDDILLYPDVARIPDEISTLWVLSTAVAQRANKANFSAISKYTARLADGSHGEVAAHLVRKSLVTTPEISETGAYAKLLTGEVGELLK